LNLSGFPLLVFGLETGKKDRNNVIRSLKQISKDIIASLTTVNLEDDAAVDGLTLATQFGVEHEIASHFRSRSREDLGDGFQQLDRAAACLDVKIVIVTLLFNAMETFLVDVLPMSDET
jgi:hypothetical protein